MRARQLFELLHPRGALHFESRLVFTHRCAAWRLEE